MHSCEVWRCVIIQRLVFSIYMCVCVCIFSLYVKVFIVCLSVCLFVSFGRDCGVFIFVEQT
jgi:hypothetical protein